ncbi:hypothetical protein [Telluria beijingensis]|uniref:hypothetical protein n=1 Tax=Telluria beijingensis TaxID=3068633 RepID=UPI002795DBCA|nr:hypothetical protein [Massilia sp. REN29]
MVSRASLKGGSLLLLTGLAVAGATWAFWHYLGESAFAVLMTIALTALWIDNRRLRRQLGNKPSSWPEQR